MARRRQKKRPSPWHLPGLLHWSAASLIGMLACHVLLNFSRKYESRVALTEIMNILRASALILAILHLNALQRAHLRTHPRNLPTQLGTAVLSAVTVIALFPHRNATVLTLGLVAALVSYCSAESANRIYRHNKAYDLSGLARYEDDQ